MNIFKANTEALVATGIYHKEKKKVYYKYFKINYEHYLQVTSITSSYFVGQNKKKKAEQQLYYAMKLQNELQQLDILIPGER